MIELVAFLVVIGLLFVIFHKPAIKAPAMHSVIIDPPARPLGEKPVADKPVVAAPPQVTTFDFNDLYGQRPASPPQDQPRA